MGSKTTDANGIVNDENNKWSLENYPFVIAGIVAFGTVVILVIFIWIKWKKKDIFDVCKHQK